MIPSSTTVSRVLTFVFGAAPMLLWLPLLLIWVLGITGATWENLSDADAIDIGLAVLFIAWGIFGLWGGYSLWAAAIGPIPVARSTAYGLGAGIAAMILTLILIRKEGASGFPDHYASWMIAGPVVVATWHIYKRQRI